MTSLLVLNIYLLSYLISSWFENFLRRNEVRSSYLTVTKNCNHLLSERIIQLERDTVKNAQYHCCESVEINPAPASICDDVVESSICKVLSLRSWGETWYLEACHYLKKKDIVIVKFKYSKQKSLSVKIIVINTIERTSKINQMSSLNLLFLGDSSVSESMCHKKNQLSFKCRQLKKASKIFYTWFWNNFANVKLNESSQSTKGHHAIDIKTSWSWQFRRIYK